MIVPKIRYLFFLNSFAYKSNILITKNIIIVFKKKKIKIKIGYKYDILRTKNMIYFFHNYNFIQIHLLCHSKYKSKSKL